MADLLALQPNMDIRLHIVAPLARREKVFNELRRPVFSLLDRGPLSESCTYLSYDSVRELAAQPHLSHQQQRTLCGTDSRGLITGRRNSSNEQGDNDDANNDVRPKDERRSLCDG